MTPLLGAAAPGDVSQQRRAWDEHAGILRAIIAGDERAAATLAAEHVMRAGSDYLLALDMDDTTSPLDTNARPGQSLRRKASKATRSGTPRR